jgi:hypothetical protein
MHYKLSHLFLLLLISLIYTGCKDSLPPEAPGARVTNLKDGNKNKIFIIDESGKAWEVTHAANEYGFQPDQFHYGLGPFAIKPIQKPKFFYPGDENYPSNVEAHSIIAFHLTGFSRAYALHIMKRFEVANDMYLMTPVAVCFCPLANLTAVYDRKIDGTTLTLSASGWTYRNTFVLYDYETESLWYPLEGTEGLTCISGFYADKKLKELTSSKIRWNEWVKDHPKSSFLQKKQGSDKATANY